MCVADPLHRWKGLQNTVTGTFVSLSVRPKLNVKPSVMKPAVQLKPGQKRRGTQRSAVAAVKPLNSGPAVQEGPRQETACRDRQVGLHAPVTSCYSHNQGCT